MRSIVKIIILYCAIVITNSIKAQEIKTDLPTVIPPSPSVSALMKFEETPVSNYTGIPDITIPLYSAKTHSKDINLNISIKYHPTGIMANERASDIGLGWSLFAGGTVSRTVRGIADEQLILDSPNALGKVGLYHTNYTNHSNIYYTVSQSMQNQYANATTAFNAFLWDTAEKGKYDTEHDLWQFNFMGNSGRFYIEKNQNNQLVVKPLDDYRVKIINHYSSNSEDIYVPTGFTIYDEKGFKYTFDVIETSNSKTAVHSSWNGIVPDSYSLSANKFFNSSFHLSAIRDQNDNLLIEYNYKLDSKNEGFTDVSQVINDNFDGICAVDPYCGFDPEGFFDTTVNQYCPEGSEQNFKRIPARKVTSSITTVINVKKLQEINVIGSAKLFFSYEEDRVDSNINGGSRLKELSIRYLDGSQVKKFVFEHSYSHVIDTRMVLTKIKEYGSENNNFNAYQFYYQINSNSGNEFVIGSDYWGYFNYISSCLNYSNYNRQVTPRYTTTDILEKIVYPSGGCSVFDYESNRYSYIGAEPIETEYDLVYGQTISNTYTNQEAIIIDPSTSTEDRYVRFSPIDAEVYGEPTNKLYLLQVLNGSNWDTVLNLICPSNKTNCCIDYVLLKNKIYRIKKVDLSNSAGTETFSYDLYNKVERQFAYGGGNRIKRIGYFENEVPQGYYRNPDLNSLLPSKEKTFEYMDITNANISSGSLVFPKPIFQYNQTITPCFFCNGLLPNTINYRSTTKYNNLQAVKTQGADVGYQYVAVKELGVGKVLYHYKSPHEEPEIVYTNFGINNTVIPPFLPSKNTDYRRGLLISETVYDESNRKITETLNDYLIEDFIQQTGLKLFYDSASCSIGQNFNQYYDYLNYRNQIAAQPTILFYNNTVRDCDCGFPTDYIRFFPIIESYGWSKLAAKLTKNYFYDSSNNESVMETNESFIYLPYNKQIGEHTVVNSNQETMKTKYYYHIGNSAFSQNRISEIEKIETYKGNELLTQSQINYNSMWNNNVSYLPQTISTSKGTGALENKVRYLNYDEFGNPLELQQENGTIVSYIWGYNKTLPIAKIENATYTQFSSLASSLQALSNQNNEAALLTALDSLRVALPNAMVTTYTYKPLVGVETITDPKGNTTRYEYDSFGRLLAVYDNSGNKLSENQYHYRTQN